MRRQLVNAALVVAVVSVASSCAGDDDDADAVASVGGDAGVLVLNGAEIPLARATCLLGEDTFESSATSGDGLQVFAMQSNPANPVSTQILDADLVQWFPMDVQGDEAARNGSTISSDSYTYFNNQNDTSIVASFTIECP